MKKKLSIQQRLIFPIILLGIVAFISNVLSVFNINNVNFNASKIVDNYMVGLETLQNIRHTTTNIHKMALSHIVATDYSTMITIVAQIKEEEKTLEAYLKEYKNYVTEDGEAVYTQLLENYDSFKHALVYLVCFSADSKTQDAYAYANGDVAHFGSAIASNTDELYTIVSERTASARQKLSFVYIISLIIAVASVVTCLVLVLAAIRIIKKYVIKPIKGTVDTLQESSQKLDEVTGEVLKHTRTSGKSARDLSALTGSLSMAIQKVASNAVIINSSVADIKEDVHDMAEECSAITNYSSEMKIRANEMEAAAQTIKEKFGCNVLLKGGHQTGEPNDFLLDKDGSRWFYGERIDNPNTHGTGCTLSSAIAAGLAKGLELEAAVEQAKKYISEALSAMLDLGAGSGPMDHAYWV